MTTLDQIREAHQLLADFNYELHPVERGYANRTLHINLSNNTITSKPVSQEMKDIFTGGRGFGLWLLWNAVSGKTRWNDPENEIVIAGGPIGGITAYPGSGKSTVVTLSPLTNVPIDSNVGGYFGPYLKFAGWDALEIQGIAERDVIVVIDGDEGRVTIEEAPLEQIDSHLLGRELTEMYSADEKDRKNVSVVSAGQAAEYVRYSIMNFSFYDLRRKEIRVKQAGRGGCGRVFRQKRIKALVVRYSSMKGDSNNPADMDLIRKAGKRINQEISDLDSKQNNMREVGTAHLPPIMDHFDLLPTHNYRYGSHPDAAKLDTAVWDKLYTHGIPDGCWYGCTLACAHGVDHFHLQTGPYKGEVVLVDGPEYETIAGLGSNIGMFDPLAILEMNFYCDTYGIDTISLGNSIAFVMECYAEGILNKERTGGLELDWGNALAALELLHQMARGEGLGVIVGQGIRYMKQYFAEHFGGDPKFMHDIGMEIKGLEISEYMTKESLAQQGGYGMASKGPQHDEAWLIFMDMVRKQLPTFEAKAEALHYFPLWRTWFSLHGLCKLPWNDIMPANNSQTAEPHKVPEHVENYTWLYEGQLRDLVGIDPSGMTTEEKLAKLRVYREAQYETLVDNVYTRRGWSAKGIPTMEKVKALGIDFPEIVELIQKNA